MTAKTSPYRSAVALNLSKSVPAMITRAFAIVSAMTDNPNFPNPTPPLADVTPAIEALNNAHAATLSRTKGAVATRNAKRRGLLALLQRLRAYVQTIADANPEMAASIILGAGMFVKTIPVIPPRIFAVKPGAVSGSVKIVCGRAARYASYEWSYSMDGENWTAAGCTIHTTRTLTGFSPGTFVSFRVRPVTREGRGSWCQPLRHMVS